MGQNFCFPSHPGPKRPIMGGSEAVGQDGGDGAGALAPNFLKLAAKGAKGDSGRLRVKIFCFPFISGCLNCDFFDYEIGMIFFRTPDDSGGSSRLWAAGQ